MATPDFPAYAEVSSAAIVGECVVASLHKADAMLVVNAPKDYRRHLNRALASFDDLAKRVETIRAALKGDLS